MESSSIEFPGSEIGAVSHRDGYLCIYFSRAYIVKTMTGSYERTRWRQSGNLVMEDAEIESGPPPEGPLVCDGGDIDDNRVVPLDNFMIYKDIIRLDRPD